jgi:cytochrome c oxidase subunit II
MNGLLGQSSGGFWMPPQASSVAGDVDGLFSFILWITIIFFLLNTALVTLFVIKYRYRPGREQAERAPSHSTALELTWTAVPTVLVLIIFYFGFRGFLHMSVMPPDAYEITVNAKMWNWSFTYPNGHTSPELHVPYNVPVRLVLTSEDVIHSFYVPQFRVKKDAVPSRFNRLWFQATERGTFDVYCAEYCGQMHSQMRAKVVVEDIDAFKKWLEDQSNWEKRMTPVEAGKMLINNNGCLQCHSQDGTIKNAPSFKDLFGKQEPLTDGSTVLVDEAYLRESLIDPAAKIVSGFRPLMPSYRPQLKDRDLNAIIAYLKTISTNFQSAVPTSAPTTAP